MSEARSSLGHSGVTFEHTVYLLNLYFNMKRQHCECGSLIPTILCSPNENKEP